MLLDKTEVLNDYDFILLQFSFFTVARRKDGKNSNSVLKFSFVLDMRLLVLRKQFVFKRFSFLS